MILIAEIRKIYVETVNVRHRLGIVFCAWLEFELTLRE